MPNRDGFGDMTSSGVTVWRLRGLAKRKRIPMFVMTLAAISMTMYSQRPRSPTHQSLPSAAIMPPSMLSFAVRHISRQGASRAGAACTTSCRTGRCRLISCQCEATAQPPWNAMPLDSFAESLPASIAWSLQPIGNAVCTPRTAAEFMQTRRAKDVLLALSTVSPAFPKSEQTSSRTHAARPEPSTRTQMPILLTILDWFFRDRLYMKRNGAGSAKHANNKHSWWVCLRRWLREMLIEVARGVDALRASLVKLSTLLFMASVLLMSVA